MKVLFIGGTGFISTAVSRVAIAAGFELYLLNRGLHGADVPGSPHPDRRHPPPRRGSRRAARGWSSTWSSTGSPTRRDDIERDLALFRGRVRQFVFISSASAYQKPPRHYLITESTPLANPYWQYSRDKIACEERLMRACRDEGFPVTIVRPSMTYDRNLPIALGGWGTYTLADRLLRGLPIIVHGDGSSLWVVTHAEDFARGFLGAAGKRAGARRGVPHHLRRGADLEPDLPDDRRGAGGGGGHRAHPVRLHRRAWRRRWPGACSATRRGAWCSTTARSSGSCRGSRPRSPSGMASAERWTGSPRMRAAGSWTGP